MSSDEELFGPGRRRAFSPYLSPGERAQLRELLDVGECLPPSFSEELRALARRYIDDGDSVKLRAVCLLVADLCDQGWRVDVARDRITFAPPGIVRNEAQSVADVKARVRAALERARARQLAEPSVRQFIRRMERSTVRDGRRTSIADVIDDGAALARAFAEIAAISGSEREAALARLVDPVVEVCEAGAKCLETGLSLMDIWRYFRHTWAHEYRAVPGRQMMLLVRNAARPGRPVMGIAMLASPVMRLTARDRWIGWLRPEAEERVRTGFWDAAAFGEALLAQIEASIDAVRWDDLATASEIADPTETVALRLEQKASGAAFAREQLLRDYYQAHRALDGFAPPFRGPVISSSKDADLRAASEELLFVRKRAESLGRLLFAKGMLHGSGLAEAPARALEQLFVARSGQRALDIVLAEFRKAGLSSEVADVSICGAIHPYNQLLGGKLVALLLTSREVRRAYARRYGGQPSVIASQMAGRIVSKPAELRILTTTSLYGVGSSQYNRLALRSSEHPELLDDINWDPIGRSLTGGYGTLHLGAETADALRSMAVARHDARRVNNRFGEGTSPRLRQIREGLDALGLKSNDILHHATPRIFYGCELGPDAREALLGLATAPDRAPSASDIASAWRRRWLSGRVLRPETLDQLVGLGARSVRTSLLPESDQQLTLPFEEV